MSYGCKYRYVYLDSALPIYLHRPQWVNAVADFRKDGFVVCVSIYTYGCNRIRFGNVVFSVEKLYTQIKQMFIEQVEKTAH